MPMTNAERQAKWRARRNELAKRWLDANPEHRLKQNQKSRERYRKQKQKQKWGKK
jgi:hypothetical protein